MTIQEASKLKAGDKVLWPAGANGCAESIGVVTKDEKYGNLFVLWPDTPEQRTYLHDKDAVKYLKSLASTVAVTPSKIGPTVDASTAGVVGR